MPSRPAALVVLWAGLLPAASGQDYLEDPLRFWPQESAYLGSEACEACHTDIYRRHLATNHATSLRPVSEVEVFTTGPPVVRRDRASSSVLTLDSRSDAGVVLRSEKNDVTAEATLEWAFGSGAKGITPVGRTADGRWVESRLTWYRSLPGIEFTTGASQYEPQDARDSLGRGLSGSEVAECFGCHTTGFDATRQVPARNEMGIHCERCHGPGEAHVLAAVAGSEASADIFNPGSLQAFAQTQMCGACHGKPPQDNDFDALALLEATPHSVRFPSQRIVLSRCFNESLGELACTTCHDPHSDVREDAAQLETACLRCHESGTRRKPSVCPVSSTDCASCHMPSERVMRHSMFSDHWIRVVRKD